MARPRDIAHCAPALARVLTLATLLACAGVTYQRPGQPMPASASEAVVFGRVRFFYDGKEFFPWQAKVDVFPMANSERHVWLLRLGRRSVSAELHPEGNGSLAIWLERGDYALVGSTEALGAGTGAFVVVALFRVPAGSSASDLGELTFRTESREGGRVATTEFGAASVAVLPPDSARAALEKRFGTLPQPFIVSPWCVGDSLPAFNDPDLATRGTSMLDHGCGEPR